MLTTALKAIFGSRNDRLLKQYRKTVETINALEPEAEKLSDEQLAAKTPELKAKLAAGAALDSILPEAFAVVREASHRQLEHWIMPQCVSIIAVPRVRLRRPEGRLS